MKKKKESNYLEKYLKDELDKIGVFNCKGNPEGLKGFPDRIVFARTIYFIELKLGKENGSYYVQTPLQKKWQTTIEQSGGVYLLVTSREEIDFLIEYFKSSCEEGKIVNQFNWME